MNNELNEQRNLHTLNLNPKPPYGHDVNWNTFPTISSPVGICQVNKPRFTQFSAMCALLALSFPFCISGTKPAAIARQEEEHAKKALLRAHKVCFIGFPSGTRSACPRISMDSRVLQRAGRSLKRAG